MATDYVVNTTQPYTYIDQANRLVNGYKVTFAITAYNEVHNVTVPSLNPDVVGAAIKAIVEQRKKLAAL